MEHLQYPIGKFNAGQEHSPEAIKSYINNIKQLPAILNELCNNLTDIDLAKTYRPDGWNVKQVIHHISDSHINCYIRIKLALTEDNPTIKPYQEDLWMKTKENDLINYRVSLQLIEAIHTKIVSLASTLNADELARTYVHPQYQRTSPISDVLALYSWHGKHHVAHIQLALGKKIAY